MSFSTRTPVERASDFLSSNGSSTVIIFVLCSLLAVVIRAVVGVHPHSGMGCPPMYGDFEAQRHWMEITTSLPVLEWYQNTTDNNLTYWGLDYPPLTAYHSWLNGKILGWVNPESMALGSSRGYETPEFRAQMRLTVLIADLLIYFPAAVVFVFAAYPRELGRERIRALAGILLQPALILVDHGHFQYNAVSLGLCVFSFASFVQNFNQEAQSSGAHSGLRDGFGAVAFCLALYYKQMCLYLAWPVFVYLLAKNMRSKRSVAGISVLAVAVIVTTTLCWLPFLATQRIDDVLQVVRRLFPFSRGLYEDKVANVWCTLSLILKLDRWLTPSAMIRLCGATTFVSMIPSTWLLWRSPSSLNFMHACVCCGLSFFLFSYQVHEKSILLPLLPATLLFTKTPFASGWFITVAAFSIFPLLERDGLALPYMVLVAAYNCFVAPPASPKCIFARNCRRLSNAAMITIHCVSAMVDPPKRYPDLITYLFVTCSCLHFLGFWMFYLTKQWGTTRVPLSPAYDSLGRRSRPFRIAFVHPDLGIGGAERLVVDAAVGLQNHGHQLTIYTAHHDPSHSFEETHDGTLSVVVYGDWLPTSVCRRFMAVCAYVRVLWVSLRVVGLSLSGKIDVIFVDQVSHSIPLLKALTGAKVVFYCHYPDYLLTPRKTCCKKLYRAPLDWAEEQTTGMADKILVNSGFTAKTFAASFKSLASRGIVPDILYPAINIKNQKIDGKADDGLGLEGKQILLSINRFERKKNIGLAVQSLAALYDLNNMADREILLIIAGGCDDRVVENVEVKEELEAMARDAGLFIEEGHQDNKVLFLTNISNNTKLRLLEHATCLLYTPDREHFGIVPVEAMYAKCPVIAVNSGGPLESIVDYGLPGATGFLRPQNAHQWANAIEMLVSDHSLRNTMGNCGRERVLEKFSLQSFAKTLETHITQTCVSRGATVEDDRQKQD